MLHSPSLPGDFPFSPHLLSPPLPPPLPLLDTAQALGANQPSSPERNALQEQRASRTSIGPAPPPLRLFKYPRNRVCSCSEARLLVMRLTETATDSCGP